MTNAVSNIINMREKKVNKKLFIKSNFGYSNVEIPGLFIEKGLFVVLGGEKDV